MRKFIIIPFLFIITGQLGATVKDTLNPELTKGQSDNLFYLGKLWGFLKFYHPVVASGKMNWDEELVKMIPRCLAVKSREERDTLLLHWVTGLGEVPACKSCSDSVLGIAKSKPDLQWISDGFFSTELSNRLKYIVQNRKQGELYYIKFMADEGIELPLAQHEATYGRMSYPAYEYRMLALFRFWNAVEYWYPYKYGPIEKWDAVLHKFIPQIAAQKNSTGYLEGIQQWVTALQDGHGFIRSALLEEMTGGYYMPFTIKMIERKAVISSFLNDSLAKASGVQVGDVIESIDGRKIMTIIDSLRPYSPASNEGDLLRKMGYRLTRSHNSSAALQISRAGATLNIPVSNYKPANWMMLSLDPPLFAHQQDATGFFMMPGSIGYINMGKLNRNDSIALKNMIAAAKGLIIDNRQNADESNGTGAGDIVADLILPPNGHYIRFGSVTSSYPGVFRMTPPLNMNTKGSDSCYSGKIAILVDNGTISVGECMTMIFQKAKQAVVVGTTTAGADGNVTYLTLPGSIWMQYTGLGIYYPDGKETQRIGLTPDISVTPTVAGLREHRDEILEAAISYLKR